MALLSPALWIASRWIGIACGFDEGVVMVATCTDGVTLRHDPTVGVDLSGWWLGKPPEWRGGWWPHLSHPETFFDQPPAKASLFFVPFWIPLLIGFVPSVLIWWRGHEMNHCKYCDYNLTGNTSGVCPECGSPINSPPEVSTVHE